MTTYKITQPYEYALLLSQRSTYNKMLYSLRSSSPLRKELVDRVSRLEEAILSYELRMHHEREVTR